jgi:hypothetical protein
MNVEQYSISLVLAGQDIGHMWAVGKGLLAIVLGDRGWNNDRLSGPI